MKIVGFRKVPWSKFCAEDLEVLMQHNYASQFKIYLLSCPGTWNLCMANVMFENISQFVVFTL
jgi:hypothetical protein